MQISSQNKCHLKSHHIAMSSFDTSTCYWNSYFSDNRTFFFAPTAVVLLAWRKKADRDVDCYIKKNDVLQYYTTVTNSWTALAYSYDLPCTSHLMIWSNEEHCCWHSEQVKQNRKHVFAWGALYTNVGQTWTVPITNGWRQRGTSEANSLGILEINLRVYLIHYFN